MSAGIVEVWFSKGLPLVLKQNFGDQALIQANRGSHKILIPGEHDLTPRVRVMPNLEYLLKVFEDGIGQLHSIYPISAQDQLLDNVIPHQNNPTFVEEPVRPINQETPEQFVVGFSSEQLLLFAYLFYISSDVDARLDALDYLKERRRSKN